MIEKESVDPSTHCHTPRWSAYNGSHPRGRHRLPEASWVGRLERWVSSGFRRDPVSASKEESYQGRDAMFTSGLHMQLHMCSPTYTLAHVPDTHIHGKKAKIKWKGRREPGNQGRETGRWKEVSLSKSCHSTFCSFWSSACRQLPPLSPASPSTEVFSVWRRERITRECLTAHTDVTASPVVCHPHLNAQCS